MPVDEEAAPSAEETEVEETPDSETPESHGSESDHSVDDDGKPESKTIPYSRFKEVNERLNNAVAWIEKAKPLVEAYLADRKKDKSGGSDKSESTSEEKPLTPAQRDAIRKTMKQAYPELIEKMEEDQRREAAAEDAMFTRAQRDITRMAKDAGYPADDDTLATVGEMVMHRIREDEDLFKLWLARDPACFEEAFSDVRKRIDALSRKANVPALQKGRLKGKLPTVPAGGAPSLTSRPKRKPEDVGITKSAHEDAWAIMQSYNQDH